RAAPVLGRHPERAGQPGPVGPLSWRRAGFGIPARPNLVQPFAEAPQPRGESGLFGGPGVPVSARAVAHVPTPATSGRSPPPRSRADHTDRAPSLSRIGQFLATKCACSTLSPSRASASAFPDGLPQRRAYGRSRWRVLGWQGCPLPPPGFRSVSRGAPAGGAPVVDIAAL